MSDERMMAARIKAVALKVEELCMWYLANNQGKPPKEVCEDTKAYRGKVIRWLDPPLPGIDNYVLIEEFIGGGDNWSLRFELRNK